MVYHFTCVIYKQKKRTIVIRFEVVSVCINVDLVIIVTAANVQSTVQDGFLTIPQNCCFIHQSKYLAPRPPSSFSLPTCQHSQAILLLYLLADRWTKEDPRNQSKFDWTLFHPISCGWLLANYLGSVLLIGRYAQVQKLNCTTMVKAAGRQSLTKETLVELLLADSECRARLQAASAVLFPLLIVGGSINLRSFCSASGWSINLRGFCSASG